MVSRKGNNTTLQDTLHSDAAAKKQAINYVRDFSMQMANYSNHKTEEALMLLNRSATLLGTAIHAQHFTPTQLEISKFFIDLHAVMGVLGTETDALWTCVTLLQHCSRNLEARRAIIEEYRFVPLLTFVLKRTMALDKQQRLLTLLQELTYGICITWEEPYIVVLLEQLVQLIYNAADEETQAHLALSIVINLCYKNFVVLFLLLRSVNISSFSRSIQNYGMLANKMLIILSEDIYSPAEKELHLFLRSTFTAIDECIKQCNVPQLRHIVDFLLDSKVHNGLHMAMLRYAHYCEDIERLLDQLESHANNDDSNEEQRKQQHICMSLLFQLIRYILELSVLSEPDGTENIISLDSIVPRIYELLGNWFESEVCGVDAVNLLEALVRLAKKESLAPRIARQPSVVVELIAATEQREMSARQTTAILQLLLTLLHQAKTEKLILSKITESYFDKIFAPLLASKADTPAQTLAIEEIEKSVYCLLLLINFAGIAKKAYFEKCCTLLQLPQIQYALARAMLNGSEMVCSAVFQISQFEHFPQQQVAQHMAKLNASTTHVAAITPDGDQWRNLNVLLKSHKTFVSKETEERLHALIELITTAQQNNQLSNVATTQMIELFNYKIEKFDCVERSMRKRLDDASNEITNLTQRINLQNAELQKYHTMNFELHINQEGLQTQCNDLKQQKDNLKRNMTDLMKKLAEKTETLQITDKRLNVKVSEMIVLKKEQSELKEQLHAKIAEADQLQDTVKENTIRLEKLKKSVAQYETELKEKQRATEDKERELAKTQKSLEEQKEAKKKLDGVITVLETQLQEKNEQIQRELAKAHKALEEQREAKKKADGLITVLEAQLQEKSEQVRNYEIELSETEEMRKTIMSLMESKRPKRKA